MKTFESHFQARDGQKLHVQGWEPDGKIKGVVVLMHGLGEYSGRYAHVGAALTKGGYALIGFDLRGHGRTQGLRGYAPSFDALMQDMEAFFAFVKVRYSTGVPYFQFGHSLGALLTVAYHLYGKPDVKGVLIIAPGFASPVLEQKGKVLLARTLGSLLPRLIIPTGLEMKALSRDPKVVEAYAKDPLVHDKVSLSLGKAGLQAVDYAFEHAPEFRAPLLIMHGTADRVVYPRGGQKFIGMVSSKDATFKPWQGLFHEIHNEPEQAEVFRTMIEWLDAHL